MASFLRDVECPVCGHRHSFGLPAGEWPTGTACDFACPQTGTKTTLVLGTTREDLLCHPQGTILLTPQVPNPSPP